MSTHRTRLRAMSVVAGIGIVALLVAGCARGGDSGSPSGGTSAPSPGITDTSITLGITTPLSGPTAGPGTCTVAGITAYFGAKNADGGVKFGDGKTRKVEIKALDDAYDPQKAAANYDQLKDSVFAMTAGLGTPTNRAWREAAIADKVPQVLIQTGDPIFSDSTQSPWQLGFVPIYQNEGAAFGKLLAASSGEHKVAILSQNDDYGKGYVEGFKSAIKDASNIKIVKELTYEATDTSVDAQLTELAGTGADVDHAARDLVAAEGPGAQVAAQLVPSVEHVQPEGDPRAGRGVRVPRRLHGVIREGGRKPRVCKGPRCGQVPGRPQAVRELPRHPGVPALLVELHDRRHARAGLREDDPADARRLHEAAAHDLGLHGTSDARWHVGRHDEGRPAGRLDRHRAEVQRQGLRERGDLRMTTASLT
jgi:hypothetical protein